MLKIGILTYHRARNYGAYLQAYGLCQRLNEEPDIDAEIIDFHMQKEVDFYMHKPNKKLAWLRQLKWRMTHFSTFLHEKKLQKTFDAAMEKMLKSKEYLCSDSIEDFQKFVKGKYDVIIAGSDEIWYMKSLRGFPTPYWLPGDLGCLKFSYAASSRSDLSQYDKQTINKINILLNGFSYLSVRDETTRKNFCEYLDLNTEPVLYSDPSFIYDYKPNAEHGRELLKEIKRNKPNKKVAVIMVSLYNIEAADQIKKELSDEYQLLSVFDWHRGYINVSYLSPFDWIDVIAGADLICASFFHAICFSVICQKPFIALNIDNKESKLRDVLEGSENMDRLIDEDQLFKPGFLKQKAKELSYPCNGAEYVEKNRLRFEDYLVVLRKCVSERINK